MSLIKVGFLVDGMLEVYCNRCPNVVGLFTGDEIGQMSVAGIEVVCWDCEPGNADAVPSQLKMDDDYFCVIVDGLPFLAAWCACPVGSEVYEVFYQGLHNQDIESAVGRLERMGAAPLSSGTYQHKNSGLLEVK